MSLQFAYYFSPLPLFLRVLPTFALFPRCEKVFKANIGHFCKKYFGRHQFSSKWQQSLLCGSKRDTPTALFPSFVSNDTNTENVSWFLAPKVLKIFLWNIHTGFFKVKHIADGRNHSLWNWRKVFIYLFMLLRRLLFAISERKICSLPALQWQLFIQMRMAILHPSPLCCTSFLVEGKT